MVLFLMTLYLFGESVTVLPTQGHTGDDFSFTVTLDSTQENQYESIYLRIYENNGDYYDYKLDESSENIYKLTFAVDEASQNKAFIIGMQDFHGQMHWQTVKHFFSVSDEVDFDTKKLPSDGIKVSEMYVDEVMKNVLNCLDHKRGYTVWNGVKHYGCWVSGRNTYCARFVRMCFGEARKYGTAIQMYRHYKRESLIQKKEIPPKGSVVFYKTRSGFGHVGIADGTGGLFSAASYVKGVKHDDVFTSRAKYLGYVSAFDFKEFY